VTDLVVHRKLPGDWKNSKRLVEVQNNLTVRDLKINGKDIMKILIYLRPEVGVILTKLYNEVVRKIKNDRKTLQTPKQNFA
jgi:tagatose-1,6-bisphosphate aldolase